ncbi:MULTISPECIES: DeoR/GlpR family DNA-binding transcription regulator [Paenibacillus]|uniref:DeoR/GlpR family DNA-binding transcription regulator n=1 Tax=Paenibacillus TaxID=44249 RepID=UPI00037DB164|nr:DeoR/GlpR family DNA-binding transcription regulator [Paenibacillus massiliensis]
MNPLLRYEKIMEALLTDKEITVNELSQRLKVTGKTIREDLKRLEEQGLVVRVHGGAMLANREQFGILPEKETRVKNADEKQHIAELASQLIEPNDIIALDGGSTTLAIARLLGSSPVTVITNDVHIISELATKDLIRLVIPGGYRVRNMLTGPEGVNYVQHLNIQKAFVSSTGVHWEHGLSVYTGDFIDFKKALVDTAQQVYAVADHHKFGQTALRTFAQLSQLNAVLSDRLPTGDMLKAFQATGISMICTTEGVSDL